MSQADNDEFKQIPSAYRATYIFDSASFISHLARHFISEHFASIIVRSVQLPEKMSQSKIHSPSRRRIYCNPQAQSWTSTTSGANFEEISSFHHKLPGYSPTKLISLEEVARQIGVKAVYLKNETSRCELPSFKILGASWAAFRAIAERNSLPLDVSLEDLAKVAQAANTRLFAATDGNHGRAVARFSHILGIASEIFVPAYVDSSTVNKIKSEGAHVVLVQGAYDQAVQEAMNMAASTDGALCIQDTATKDYERIPQVSA